MRDVWLDGLAAFVLPIAARQHARHQRFAGDRHHREGAAVAALPDRILKLPDLRNGFRVTKRAEQESASNQVAFRRGAAPFFQQGFPQRLANTGLHWVRGGKWRHRDPGGSDCKVSQVDHERVALAQGNRLVQKPNGGLFLVVGRDLPEGLHADDGKAIGVTFLFVIGFGKVKWKFYFLALFDLQRRREGERRSVPLLAAGSLLFGDCLRNDFDPYGGKPLLGEGQGQFGALLWFVAEQDGGVRPDGKVCLGNAIGVFHLQSDLRPWHGPAA